MRTAALTAAALVAFAANSILCRAALGGALIDAVSFTTVRIASGAAVLTLLVLLRGRGGRSPRWPLAAGALFTYAILFSLAYRTLTAGTGALLLFGATQATMIGVALRRGERPRWIEWVGFSLAIVGLVWLVAPDLASPEPLGGLFMLIAGASWGVYSLLGRANTDPLGATAVNFAAALPPALAASAVAGGRAHVTAEGLALAATSGAIASGLGYVVWYAAIRGLRATRAATVQLLVPLLTAIAGVAFLGESVTARLVFAALLILGGVALAIRGRSDPR